MHIKELLGVSSGRRADGPTRAVALAGLLLVVVAALLILRIDWPLLARLGLVLAAALGLGACIGLLSVVVERGRRP